MTLRLSFCCADTEPAPWLEGLRSALPDAEVRAWQTGDAPADYAIVWQPPQVFFDEQPQIKAAFNLGAGVDALLRLNIAPSTKLVRLDDAGMAVQIAEYVCHALIRSYRGFGVYAQQASHSNWRVNTSPERDAFPVGIMGLGVLGERVARMVGALEFPVNGWSRSPKQIDGVRCYSGQEQLGEFLAASKVLVCVLPLTPQTQGILNRTTLSQLQSGAYLINVGRGAHLVEEDLLALLDSSQMAGATLDVFRTEPLPPGHPFWKHPQVEVTPHIAALTQRKRTIRQIVDKLHQLERGEAVAGLVDASAGY